MNRAGANNKNTCPVCKEQYSQLRKHWKSSANLCKTYPMACSAFDAVGVGRDKLMVVCVLDLEQTKRTYYQYVY